MKRLAIIVLSCLSILLTTSFGLQAQTAKPIPTIVKGAKWSQLRRLCHPSLSHVTSEWTYRYAFGESVTVDGVEYLTLKGDPSTLFREDLDQGKVYIRYQNKHLYNDVIYSTSDLVLFDYSVEVGDSITFYDNEADHAYQLQSLEELEFFKQRICHPVTKVYTDQIAGKLRRVYEFDENVGHLHSDLPIRWIEGIGFNTGFLFHVDVMITGNYGDTRELLCYHSLSGETFHFHESGLCKIGDYRGVDDLDMPNVSLSVTKGHLEVATDDAVQHTLAVYTYDGGTLVTPTTFVGGIAVALPEGLHSKLIVLVDGQAIPMVR